MSLVGVILVRIFPHSDWITPNRDNFYAAVPFHLFYYRLKELNYDLKKKNHHFYLEKYYNDLKITFLLVVKFD